MSNFGVNIILRGSLQGPTVISSSENEKVLSDVWKPVGMDWQPFGLWASLLAPTILSFSHRNSFVHFDIIFSKSIPHWLFSCSAFYHFLCPFLNNGRAIKSMRVSTTLLRRHPPCGWFWPRPGRVNSSQNSVLYLLPAEKNVPTLSAWKSLSIEGIETI